MRLLWARSDAVSCKPKADGTFMSWVWEAWHRPCVCLCFMLRKWSVTLLGNVVIMVKPSFSEIYFARNETTSLFRSKLHNACTNTSLLGLTKANRRPDVVLLQTFLKSNHAPKSVRRWWEGRGVFVPSDSCFQLVMRGIVSYQLKG